MNTLTTNFNTTFPNYSANFFTGSTSVIEPENTANGKLHELELTGIDGFSFPHKLASVLSSFADKSGHNNCLKKDCDGVILFEHKGQKYILLTELKSTFSTDEMNKAQKQIVGSSVKFISTLSVLEGFNMDEYRIIGIIASFEATAEQMTAISKRMNPLSTFAIKLNSQKKVILSGNNYQKNYYPLNVKEITLYYIPVKGNSPFHSIDITTLL